MIRLLNPFLLCLFLFASCNGANEKTAVPVSETTGPEPVTTAMQVKPVPLLLPFHLDSLFIQDTSNFLNASLYFPVAEHPHYHELNKLALELVKSKTTGFNEQKRTENESVTVNAWVSEMAVTKNIISFCFTDQNFTEGAAHYLHDYSTLNYDIEKGKVVLLTDIFNLNSEKQKSAFCDCVNPKEEGIGPDLLQVEDLNDKTDFMISNGNLIFCFGDSDMNHWLEKREFKLDLFAEFVKPEYRWLIERKD